MKNRSAARVDCFSDDGLPLANARDKRTQVRWGIRDFEKRFGRKPAGMWLPETAVNAPTLEGLVDEGLRFVVLSPHQAERSLRMARVLAAVSKGHVRGE